MTTQSHGFCLYKTDFRCFWERGGGEAISINRQIVKTKITNSDFKLQLEEFGQILVRYLGKFLAH